MKSAQLSSGLGDRKLVEIDPTILTIIGVGIAAISLLVGILGSSLRHARNHGKLDNQIRNLETTLAQSKEPLEYANALWQLSKSPGIIDLVKKVGPELPKRNPYDPARKSELLRRYQDGTVGLDEAKELQGILQEDLKHAEDTNSAALVGIVILLAALVVIIAMLGSKD